MSMRQEPRYFVTSILCYQVLEYFLPESSCYLKDRRNPPHVDEARAKVLPGREEEGEKGDPKTEGQQQELNKVMFLCYVCDEEEVFLELGRDHII